jgi:Zn finger protein HypA/HybF involved in hydrogenase expression
VLCSALLCPRETRANNLKVAERFSCLLESTPGWSRVCGGGGRAVLLLAGRLAKVCIACQLQRTLQDERLETLCERPGQESRNETQSMYSMNSFACLSNSFTHDLESTLLQLNLWLVVTEHSELTLNEPPSTVRPSINRSLNVLIETTASPKSNGHTHSCRPDDRCQPCLRAQRLTGGRWNCPRCRRWQRQSYWASSVPLIRER